MFKFFEALQSLFSGTEEPEAPSSDLDRPTTPDSQASNSDTNNPLITKVHVWHTTSDNVGHVGIEVGNKYASLHPGTFPVLGPLAIFPQPATLARSVSEDMKSEAASRNIIRIDDTSPIVVVDKPAVSQQPPDQVLEIKGLDTEKMLNYIQKTEEGIQDGTESYQLYPQIDVPNLLRTAAEYVNQDPIDTQAAHDKYHREDTNKPNNCSTFVARVINEGGGKIPISGLPWGITPNSLAHAVEKMAEKEHQSPGPSP